jgi:hypothetical protein
VRRLGARIALTTGGWSLVSAAVVALSIAVGVASMLVLLSVPPALADRADRAAWTEQALPEVEPGAPGSVTMSSQGSYIGTHGVQVVSVGEPGEDAPLPPGATSLPGPGEVMLSPALKDLLARTPGAHDRYGVTVGILGDAGLRGPDDLVALRGVDADRIVVDGSPITSFATAGSGHQSSGIERVALLLGAASLVVLVAVLVGAALRMTTTRRRRRMAALGLLGASDRQVAQIAEGEMAVPALLGAVMGVSGFVLARPAIASFGYEGAQFFVDDLWPGWAAIVVLVLTVLAACIVATRASMRHTIRDALEVTGEGADFKPRLSRWLVLCCAVVLSPLVMWLTSPDIPSYLIVAIFVFLMGGIVAAGPEMTYAAGSLLARSTRPSAILSGNRLRAHPVDTFRPAAGVALALLISTTFVALVPAAAQSLTTVDRVGQQEGSAQATLPYTSTRDSESLVLDIAGIEGISDPVAIRTGTMSTSSGPLTVWIGDCELIRSASRMDGLTCGQAPVLMTATASGAVDPHLDGEIYNLAPREVLPLTAEPRGDEITSAHFPLDEVDQMAGSGAIDLPDVIVSPAALDAPADEFRPTLILFTYVGDAAVEESRQVIEDGQPSATVATRETTFDGYSEDVRRLYETFTAGTIALAVIATLGLALSMISTMLERRRFDTTLRTIGVPDRTLRSAALLEALAPLLVAAASSTILGTAFGAGVVGLTGSTPYPLGGALRPLAVTMAISVGLIVSITLIADVRTRRATVRRE